MESSLMKYSCNTFSPTDSHPMTPKEPNGIFRWRKCLSLKKSLLAATFEEDWKSKPWFKKKKKKGMLFTVYKGDLFLWMCFFCLCFLRSHRCIFKLKMWLLALWLPGYVQAFILFSIKCRARAPLSQGWMCWSIPTVPVLWEDRGKSAEKCTAQSFSPLSW